METELRIGTSGWNYREWQGKFYPQGLPRAQELTYYGERFDTLELNSSFYRLHRASTYEKWALQVPAGFQFAVKGWRVITHSHKLKNTDANLAKFYGSGLLSLRAKLGPILWQLPPSLTFDADVLDHFLGLLPRTYREAQQLAAQAESPEPAALLELPPQDPAGLADLPLRYALEPRSAGFDSAEALDILGRHDVALVMSDMNHRHCEYRLTTGDLVYVRLHGAPRVYFSNYPEPVLAEWASEVRRWQSEARSVYFYFDNTGAGHAPQNAEQLKELVHG